MFEHKIPLFNPAPLRRDILDSLRDLAVKEQDARYGAYSDGVLAGCGLIERDMRVGVDAGLVKFGGRVYALSEAASVPYSKTDEWAVLKIRFGGEEASRDFRKFRGELVLDSNTHILPNEMELGRFKLKQGSRLRTAYEDFSDMETEYDTVCLINVPYAGIGEPTLHPEIFLRFGREGYPLAENAADAAFCAVCLANSGVVSRECAVMYVSKRLNTDGSRLDNAGLHGKLADILAGLKGAERGERGGNPDGIMLM